MENKQKLVWNEKKQCWGIFRTWRRHPKTNEIMYAKDYGKKAWFIPLSELDNAG
jgi:hypothetical protein